MRSCSAPLLLLACLSIAGPALARQAAGDRSSLARAMRTADGTERTKQQVMATSRNTKEDYRDLAIAEVKAHVFGDTGIVSARTLGFRVDASGRETPNRVRDVRVFARRQGTWLAVAQMATPLPAGQK